MLVRNLVVRLPCLFYIIAIANSAIFNKATTQKGPNNSSTLTINQQDRSHSPISNNSNMTTKNINIRKKTFKTRVSRGYLFYEVNYIKKDEDKYKEQQLKLYDSNASQRNITQILLKWPVKIQVLDESIKKILESKKISEKQFILMINSQKLAKSSKNLNDGQISNNLPFDQDFFMNGLSASDPPAMTERTPKQPIIVNIPFEEIFLMNSQPVDDPFQLNLFLDGQPIDDPPKMTNSTPKQSTSQAMNIPIEQKLFLDGQPIDDPPKMTNSTPKQSTSQAMNIPIEQKLFQDGLPIDDPPKMTNSTPKQSTSQAMNIPIEQKLFQDGQPIDDPPKMTNSTPKQSTSQTMNIPKMMTDSPPKQSNNQRICVWKASLNLSQDDIQKCLSTGITPQNSTNQKQKQNNQTNNQTQIGYHIIIQQRTNFQQFQIEPLPNQQGNYQLNIVRQYLGNPRPLFSITYEKKYWSPIQMLNENSILIQKTIKYSLVYENKLVRNLSERGYQLMKAFYQIPDIKNLYILAQSAQIISTNITYYVESVKMPTWISLEGVYVSFIGELQEFI